MITTNDKTKRIVFKDTKRAAVNDILSKNKGKTLSQTDRDAILIHLGFMDETGKSLGPTSHTKLPAK